MDGKHSDAGVNAVVASWLHDPEQAQLPMPLTVESFKHDTYAVRTCPFCSGLPFAGGGLLRRALRLVVGAAELLIVHVLIPIFIVILGVQSHLHENARVHGLSCLTVPPLSRAPAIIGTMSPHRTAAKMIAWACSGLMMGPEGAA